MGRWFLWTMAIVGVLAPEAHAGNAAGRELFLRTWLPWDSRVDGGDGLGPMYNAASCAACHNQGGAGGAGGKEHNVRLVPLDDPTQPRTPSSRFSQDPRTQDPRAFVVEHRHTTLSPSTAVRGTVAVERNTPALFGTGLVDGISEAVLLELEAAQRTAGGKVSGRVPLATDGKVGRFGWKGHTSSLGSFVATACANELGLSVEGHKQGAPPPGNLSERLDLMEQALAAYGTEKDLTGGPGLDMTSKEVAALTTFVRGLPAPAELTAQPRRDRGLELLKSTGCESCHVQNVGPVKGLYSDLLLHDMGTQLADAAGAYQTRGGAPMAAAAPTAAPDAQQVAEAGLAPDVGPTAASATEWRTPPLWGLRDSGPYLHDGRAGTLDEAIRHHGGEAEASLTAYQTLSITDQQALVSFLESLVAPSGS